MHEPNLAEFILIKVDLHFEQVKSMKVLQVEAHNVAHLDAVLKRLLFL